MALLLVAFAVFLLNVPFGIWRAGVRKFSLQWALAIHLPIPFVVLLRLNSGIGFHWTTYPVLVAAFFGGQFVGSRMQRGRLALVQPD